MEIRTLEEYILARVDELEKKLEESEKRYYELLDDYNEKCEATSKIIAILTQSNKLSEHQLALIKECLK